MAVSVAWLVGVTGAHLMPASYWMRVHSVHIDPAVHMTEPIRMTVLREVKRPFTATWTVDVHKWDDRTKQFTSYCQGSGSNAYTQGANGLPSALDLKWWSGTACPVLPVGQYAVHTNWRIHPGGLWPAKDITVVSNLFEVVAK